MGLFDFLHKNKDVEMSGMKFRFAEETVQKKTERYYVLESIEGVEGEVLEIPEAIKKIPVKEIGEGAIKDKPNLKIVRLPSDCYAPKGIHNCPNIERFEFPNGSRLYKTELDGKLIVGKGDPWSGVYGIVEVVPSFQGVLDLTNYKGNIFFDLGLGQKVSKIILGKSVTFWNAEKIAAIKKNQPGIVFDIPADHYSYEYTDGTFYRKHNTYPRDLVFYADEESIVEPVILGGPLRKEPLSTLRPIDLQDLKKIGHFKALRIPDGISVVQEGAISGLDIDELIFSHGFRDLGNRAVSNCPSLKVIHLTNRTRFPSNGNQVFYNLPSLEKFVLDDASDSTAYSVDGAGALFIHNGATLYKFPTNSALRQYKIPETVNAIGERAFEGARIEEVEFDDNLHDIGTFAFKESNLKSLYISDFAKNIGSYAFYGLRNPLEKLSIPTGLTIRENAFAKVKLTHGFVTYRGTFEWWMESKKKISPAGNEILVGPDANVVAAFRPQQK